jgi:hypothetical protein
VTGERNIWACMIQRCHNSRHPRFADYGGRGITVCERWRLSFEAFLEDVGLRPSKDHSLDRFPNNDGGYGPGNVRWATRREQQNNMRSNHRITALGETLTLAQWSRRTGIGFVTLYRRLQRGMSPTEAVTRPLDRAQSARGRGRGK